MDFMLDGGYGRRRDERDREQEDPGGYRREGEREQCSRSDKDLNWRER